MVCGSRGVVTFRTGMVAICASVVSRGGRMVALGTGMVTRRCSVVTRRCSVVADCRGVVTRGLLMVGVSTLHEFSHLCVILHGRLVVLLCTLEAVLFVLYTGQFTLDAFLLGSGPVLLGQHTLLLGVHALGLFGLALLFSLQAAVLGQSLPEPHAPVPGLLASAPD